MKKPRFTEDRSMPENSGSAMMLIAFQILTLWPKRSPKPDDLMSRFGMSKATAYRYIRSLHEARGYPVDGQAQ